MFCSQVTVALDLFIPQAVCASTWEIWKAPTQSAGMCDTSGILKGAKALNLKEEARAALGCRLFLCPQAK